MTLDPTADLAATRCTRRRSRAAPSGAKDLAGNPLAADRVWTFTTAASGTTVTYLSDRPVDLDDNGWGPVEKDRSNGENGPTDGATLTLNGVTYAKGLGAHAASDVRFALGGACSAADGAGRHRRRSRRRRQRGVPGLPRWRHRRGYDSGLMTGATATKTRVGERDRGEHAAARRDGRGPTATASDHGDWADAQVTCSSAGDTTPPTVTATSRRWPSATGVAVNANVTATFSEAMSAATLTTSTVTLVPQGSTTPVPATVTYTAATNTVTLDPTAHAAAEHRLYGDDQGRRLRREGRVRESAGGRQGLELHDRMRRRLPTISQPLSTFKFKVGDVITYAGSATDFEDGHAARHEPELEHRAVPLPGRHLPLSTRSRRHRHDRELHRARPRRRQLLRDHVDRDRQRGADGHDVGDHPAADRAVHAGPSPTGLQVIYGGTSGHGARDVHDHRRVGAHDSGGVAARGLTFANWSDGGAQQHNVMVGTTNVTFTATFTTGGGTATTTYLSDRTWATVQNGWGPVEKDRSNGEIAANDGATSRSMA